VSEREERQKQMIRDRVAGWRTGSVSLAALAQDVRALIYELEEVTDQQREALLAEYWILHAANHEEAEHGWPSEEVKANLEATAERLVSLLPGSKDGL
jgi:hypothetical protein